MQKYKYDLDVQPEQVPPELMTNIYAVLWCNNKTTNGTDTTELEKQVEQYCIEEWLCTCRCPVGEIYEIRMKCLKIDVGSEKFNQVLKEKINQKPLPGTVLFCGLFSDQFLTIMPAQTHSQKRPQTDPRSVPEADQKTIEK